MNEQLLNENMTVDEIQAIVAERLKVQQVESDKKQLMQLMAILPSKDDLTDVGQAERFVKWANGRIAWCDAYGWLIYTNTATGGGWWQYNADKQIEQLYAQFTNEQLTRALNNPMFSSKEKTDTDYAKQMLNYVISCRKSYSKIQSVLKIAASSAACLKKQHEFDTDALLLNTQTGIVDLRTGKLQPANPQLLMRNICNEGYYPDDDLSEQWNKWQEFLDQVIVDEDQQPDKDYQTYLQTIIGLSTFGKSYERLFMAYGKGGNGKSTLFDSIYKVLGSYAVSVSSDIFVDDGRSKDFKKAAFNGRRLALMQELNTGVKLNVKMLKEICSKDPIQAEFKFKDQFTFLPTHTSIMCTNDLPTVPANDDGTWDRLTILPFYGRFRGTESEDTDLCEKLVSTAGKAILQWIITGAEYAYSLDYKIDQLQPDCVKQLVSKYRKRENKAQPFVEDCCIINADANPLSYPDGTKTTVLYEAYKRYALNNGLDEVGKVKFRQDVEYLIGQQSRRNREHGEYYPCIKLKTDT